MRWRKNNEGSRSDQAIEDDGEGRLVDADALAELAGGRLKGAGELDDGGQARLPTSPLQQRDLSAVKLTAIAQLFLGYARFDPGLAEVGGEALLRSHRA